MVSEALMRDPCDDEEGFKLLTSVFPKVCLLHLLLVCVLEDCRGLGEVRGVNVEIAEVGVPGAPVHRREFPKVGTLISYPKRS